MGFSWGRPRHDIHSSILHGAMYTFFLLVAGGVTANAVQPWHGLEATLNQVSKTRCCAEGLRRIRRLILARSIHNSKPGVTVVSYCQGGNHRSVAFGELLRMATRGHNFIELKSYDVINLTDMAGSMIKPYKPRIWGSQCKGNRERFPLIRGGGKGNPECSWQMVDLFCASTWTF